MRRVLLNGTYEAQARIMTKWKDEWCACQRNYLNIIKRDIKSGDYNDVMSAINSLMDMTEKRFFTFANIIRIINGRDYDLIHEIYDVEPPQDVDEESTVNTRECKNKGYESDVVIPDEIKVDMIAKDYIGGMSIEDIASVYRISAWKAIKLLVTRGVYTSDVYDKIKDMRESGKSDDEIVDLLGMSKKSFNKYMPYEKGIYKLNDATENAKRIRESRKSLTNQY